MQIEELLKIVTDTIDERKGDNIKTIDVRGKSSVTDYMVIATGISTRHLKSLSEYVLEKVKSTGYKPLGLEGGEGSEWVLLDLGDIILHVMTAQTREFYQLEKLWETDFSTDIEQVG